MSTGGTGAATLHGYVDTSNSVIARVPLCPVLMAFQNVSRPAPKADTTPMPVIAMRGWATRIRSYNSVREEALQLERRARIPIVAAFHAGALPVSLGHA